MQNATCNLETFITLSVTKPALRFLYDSRPDQNQSRIPRTPPLAGNHQWSPPEERRLNVSAVSAAIEYSDLPEIPPLAFHPDWALTRVRDSFPNRRSISHPDRYS